VESILPLGISILNTTILSIVNAAIAGMPSQSQKIRDLLSWREAPNGDRGPYAQIITAIFDSNTAARLVDVGIQLNNPTLFCVMYRGSQGYNPARTDPPTYNGQSYPPLDDSIQSTAEDVINDIWEEWDDNAESWTQIQEAFKLRKQVAESSNPHFTWGFSDTNNSWEASQTVLLISLPIPSNVLLLTTLLFGYVSMITL
jgi:hypothetical protein